MNDMTKQAVVLPIPTDSEIRFDTGFSYGTKDRKMDLCLPTTRVAGGWPVTVLVGGYPDTGFEQIMGCKFKDMASLKSWSQLMACAGIAAVSYECEEPARDLLDVLSKLKEKSDEFGIDGSRVSLWSCSGNVPTALGAIADSSTELRCAALCYGYLADQPGYTAVADAASRFHFANPMAGRSIRELMDTPLMIVRAGADEMPGLNDSIDRFVATALQMDLPISLINYPSGVHSFDLSDGSEGSQAICRRVLDYLVHHLKPRI